MLHFYITHSPCSLSTTLWHFLPRMETETSLICPTTTSYHFLSASLSYWYTACCTPAHLSSNISDKQTASHKIMSLYNEQYSQWVALSTPFTQHLCTVQHNITTNSFMNVTDITTVFTPAIIKHQNFTLKTMFQGWFCQNLKTSNAVGYSHPLQQATKHYFQHKTKTTGKVQGQNFTLHIS